MKRNAFRRIIAAVLTASFLLGGSVVASASSAGITSASSTGSVVNGQISEYSNASYYYNDYRSTVSYMSAPAAKDVYFIPAENYDKDATTAKVYKVKVDETTGSATVVPNDYVAKDGETVGIYSPASGGISFTANIPETAKYGIAIEYFPLTSLLDSEGNTIASDNAGAIERVLKIDGMIPFAEARYIVMSKVWKNVYTIKMLQTENAEAEADTYYDKAVSCGLEARKHKSVMVNGTEQWYVTIELPDGGWTSEQLTKLSEADIRFFTTDIDNNEIRCSMERVPELRTYECRDVDGFHTESFEFLLEKGERQITLEAKSQAFVITSITLFPKEERDSFEDKKNEFIQNGYTAGSDIIKIEAEFPFASSTNTIYPIEDSSSAATSPSDTTRTVLNTLGGEKWQTSGQWVRYSFKVDEDGLYQIVSRFRQNINDGVFSSRVLYLYSEGLNEGDLGYYNGIPYFEATSLRFGYSTDWQVAPFKYSKEVQDGDRTVWEDVELEFFFKAGVTYTIELEVSLGDMGSIVSEVNTSLTKINGYYLSILQLTGADPDEYRDYGFNRIMPQVMGGLLTESKNLYRIADELRIISGEKSSNVATLEKIAWLLYEMGYDEDNVAKYMEQLKTYIGTLGTWINSNKTQPLEIDYLMIQCADAELPAANAGFFESMWHEICKFFQSFFRNYNRMGASTKDDTSGEAVNVWLSKGRDQTQVIRNLINNDFTPKYGHLVDLKLVAGGALLPSILAGAGPDVFIGIGEDTIINYAIRGALCNIENFEGFYDLTSQYKMEHKLITDYIEEMRALNYIIVKDGNTVKIDALTIDGKNKTMYTVMYESDGSGKTFDANDNIVNGFTKEGWLYEVGSDTTGVTYVYKNVYDKDGNRVVNEKAQFNEAAMFVLGLPDADNIMHYYGLPEEQNFSMMFVRNDILEKLGIDIPKTWDDIQEAIPKLQANNMEIGMSTDYKVFLYQEGSTLFADEGMRINLDSNIALDSFDYMCSLFTMYSFPYQYDFSNRFRTGEMPIGIAGYNATYNQMVVFATEIRGLWSFYPLPGVDTGKVDENGDPIINNTAVATVNAISMITGCDNQEAAWDYMRWHVGADCQVNYSNEMVAILGDSAKYATANITALESMPWTTAEYEQISSQFNNLASIPNYPGSYILGRYTNFAFLAAYNDKANPADSLKSYINLINKEITRKREEFDLETLKTEPIMFPIIEEEVTQTLASKRAAQALKLIEELDAAAKTKYEAEIAAVIMAIEEIDTWVAYVPDEDIAALRDAIYQLRDTQYYEFFEIADCLDTAANTLEGYQISYPVKD